MLSPKYIGISKGLLKISKLGQSSVTIVAFSITSVTFNRPSIDAFPTTANSVSSLGIVLVPIPTGFK